MVLFKSKESQVIGDFSKAQTDEMKLPWLRSSSPRMFEDWTEHS